MASLLDIAPPGQPWLPGTPVPNPAGLRAIDQRFNAMGGWQRPDRGYGSPNFNPFAPYNLTPPQTAASALSPTTANGNSTNPFSAETLVRNPELAALLQRLYGDIGNLSTDPSANQTVLQRNTKNAQVEQAGTDALGRARADATNNAQSIADFTRDFLADQDNAMGRATEESNAIGRLYDGSYMADLEANRRRTGNLTAENLMRRLGGINARANLGELSRGGVTNSYADAMAMREGANASLQRDMALQDLERQDIMGVMDRQTGAAGLRQRLIDAVLQRPLVPIQAGQSVAGNDVNRLGAISSLLMQNNVYTPQTRMGLIGQVQELLRGQAGVDPAAYYRYVRGNFPDAYPGVVGQGRFPLPNPAAFAGAGASAGFDDIINALNSPGGGGQPLLPSPAPAPAAAPASANGLRMLGDSEFEQLIAPYLAMAQNQTPPGVPPWNRNFALN